MDVYTLFKVLIGVHILFGAPGLVLFWLPVIVKKGGPRHKRFGRLFAVAMLVTACTAAGMAALSLAAPMATHPHLVHHPEFSDPAIVRAIFGHMMLYLAILTINLTWYAWCCTTHKTDQAAQRRGLNLWLQWILLAAALNCALQGLVIGVPLIGLASLVGFATVATNVSFLWRRNARPVDWLLEHIKGIIGTGIYVYTAFLEFGAVRLMPEAALSPALWALPLVTGVALIIYHQQKILRPIRARERLARVAATLKS